MSASQRLLALLGVRFPVIQAPMAGAQDEELAGVVAEAGGLGSLPCAFLTPDAVKKQVEALRARTSAPFNLNFFCHAPPEATPDVDAAWRASLAPYYQELAVALDAAALAPIRQPYDEAMCELVEQLRPPIVSFHFGLPASSLLDRTRAAGARILCSATSVAEARELEAQGVDAIIAQGSEAGGHRGMFLSHDPASQVGTFALVPQLVDAVKVPIIASGGIADARGVAAAFALGAAGVQVGTAYLRCPESRITPMHRRALATAQADETRLTNVFSGRPARGIQNRIVRERGPLSEITPPFPLAARALAPLRRQAEAAGLGDFSPLWAGQAVALTREMTARDLTLLLASGVPGPNVR
jgi:nitronate monooxygenase